MKHSDLNDTLQRERDRIHEHLYELENMPLHKKAFELHKKMHDRLKRINKTIKYIKQYNKF